jgi:hypothetical protein
LQRRTPSIGWKLAGRRHTSWNAPDPSGRSPPPCPGEGRGFDSLGRSKCGAGKIDRMACSSLLGIGVFRPCPQRVRGLRDSHRFRCSRERGIEAVNVEFVVAGEQVNVAIRRNANRLISRWWPSPLPRGDRQRSGRRRRSWKLSPPSNPRKTILHPDRGFRSRHGCQTWADD